MKKSDLKTGMWIETKRGERAIVLLGTKDGDILSGESKYCPLKNYDENLQYTGLGYASSSSNANIVKIYQPNDNASYWNNGGKENYTELIWDRDEKDKKIAKIRARIDKAQQELTNAQNELDDLER